MKKISPPFLNGILLVAGGIRFLSEPLGFALVLLGGIVVLFELPAVNKSFPG